MPKNTGNLYLQLSANTDTYVRALKAAKASTQDFAGDVDAQISGVQAAFEKLGGTNVSATAKAMEASFRSSFNSIRASAEQALTLPRTDAGALSINLVGAQQAQADAEKVAIGLREIADAAAKLVIGNDAASDAEKRNAVSSEAAAQGAEARVGAIREEVLALQRLQTALNEAGKSSVEAAVENDEITGSHTRLGASGLIAEHVVRSFSDSVTAGQSPVRAFALEIPRVTEALQFLAMESNATEGALGKFAGFMGGPLGLAVTLAISLLAPFVAKLAEGADGSDDMTKKVETLAAALNDEAASTDKARKALEAYNAEKKNARDQDAAATQATLEKAKADLQAAIATRAALQAEAQRYFNQNAANPAGGAAAQAFAGLALDHQANKQTGLITDLQQAIRNIEIDQAKDAAKAAADPLEAIRLRYKDLAASAVAAAAGNDKLAASLKGTLSGYAREEAAEIKAAEARKAADRRTTGDDRQFGRTVTLDQAEDIVRGIGGRVTSAQRSTAEQAALYARYQAGQGPLAAKPGTSLHERGEALDVAKGAGISLATLKEAFAKAGVRLTEALDEGDHYHVGFGPKGGRGASADTLARRQQAAVRKDANDDRAYQGEDRQANDAIAKVRAELANTLDARYQVQLEELRSDLASRVAALQDQVTAGKLTKVQADSLEAKAREAEQDQEALLARKKQADLIQQGLQRDQLQIDGSKALLDIASTLATTTEQRRDIALQLLALDELRLRKEQQAIIDNPTSTVDQKDAAKVRLDQIDAQHPGRVQTIKEQNASPLQAYGQQLHKSTDDMGEALQGVAVNGLKGLEDGLTGLVTGTESVSSAFKKMASSIVADLARIAIEKLIVKAIGGSLLGFADGGEVQAHADGGFITGAGGPRSDSILSWLSNGEFVMNASSTSKYLPVLHAMNDNRLPKFADGGLVGSLSSVPTMRDISRGEVEQIARHQPVEYHYHVSNSFVDQELWDRMHSIARGVAAPMAQAAMIGGATQANEDWRDHQMQQMP